MHHGVNVRSLMRATLSNFASEGPVQGASTITMQVVKNDYMAGFERDGRYKLLQITYAVRLEKHKTKDEILERYLNTVFFGQNSYGIAAAAETYFGKRVADLTFIEAAFLAGLVQAPSSYDPITQPRAQPHAVHPGARPAGGGGAAHRGRARQVADRHLRAARAGAASRRSARSSRTYYSEALRDYLLNRSTSSAPPTRSGTRACTAAV